MWQVRAPSVVLPLFLALRYGYRRVRRRPFECALAFALGILAVDLGASLVAEKLAGPTLLLEPFAWFCAA